MVDAALLPLHDFIARYPRLFVLTGAGCSTDSGIPDYRDGAGAWKRPPPMTFQLFTGDALARARYWARALIGWRRFSAAQPNRSHRALAQLEQAGRIDMLVTQNVDRLHQAAGSARVIDLHGRLDRVRCLTCGASLPRADFQRELERLNPDWRDLDAMTLPDGDADLEGIDFSSFIVPPHVQCGGMLKPDVVFFGEAVPRERVQRALAHLEQAEAVLVVGSSLMVYSGFRFVARAAQRGIPIAALNLGRTRADDLLALKIERSCAAALSELAASVASLADTPLADNPPADTRPADTPSAHHSLQAANGKPT